MEVCVAGGPAYAARPDAMVHSDLRLPFVISEADIAWVGSGGHIEPSVYRELPVSGLMRLEAHALCFQFRRKHTGWTLADGAAYWTAIFGGGRPKKEPEIEDVCVPLDQIMKVSFKRSRWFQGKLRLHANDLNAFAQIPGTPGLRLALRIAKEHADLGESFVSRLQLALSQRALRHLDDEME